MSVTKKKSPGYDLITIEILKKLPKKRTNFPHRTVQCHNKNMSLPNPIEIRSNYYDFETWKTRKSTFFISTDQPAPPNIKNTRKTFSQ